MRRFLKYVLFLLTALLLIMAALDILYTAVYESAAPRTKFGLLRASKGKQIDYVFVGSSRVENGVVPGVIAQKTGKSALNLGFQAAKMEDILTLVKLLRAYDIKARTVCIQVDYNFDVTGRSIALPFEMAPFIRDNEVTRNYYQDQENFFGLYYAPFYRYNVFDHKIGLREVVMTVLKGNRTSIPDGGYAPPTRKDTIGTKYALPKRISRYNRTFEAIDMFCRANEINVVYYCAPFWHQTQNLGYIKKLKEKIPGLMDYSGAITDPAMFNNNAHLNDAGARHFTQLMIRDLEARP